MRELLTDVNIHARMRHNFPGEVHTVLTIRARNDRCAPPPGSCSKMPVFHQRRHNAGISFLRS